jgi:pimeloyl-ACP methyl ester carboxylesterase
MSHVLLIASWLLAVLFGLATISFFLMGLAPQAIALLGIMLVLLPPVRSLIGNLAGHPVPWWVWGGLVALLLVALIPLGKINRPTSIYKSPEVRQRFMQMYDDNMKARPVPYEDLSVDTAYGRAHVIASGPREAPPILLLHASGVGGWSWSFNAEALSRDYRIFAIDTLGDAGKSELANVDLYPQNGQQQGELVAEIADKLGMEAAYVVGASEGGFIGTSYALYAPERVNTLLVEFLGEG